MRCRHDLRGVIYEMVSAHSADPAGDRHRGNGDHQRGEGAEGISKGRCIYQVP